MKQLSEKIKNMLKEKGYKVTLQREKILDIIIKNQSKHLTSDEIYMIIKNDYPEIGLATVYRTMQLLEKTNIVCKFDSDENRIRYELMEPDDKFPHPHFICKACGRVYPVKEAISDSMKDDFNKHYGFKIVSYDLKFYGICKNCNRL